MPQVSRNVERTIQAVSIRYNNLVYEMQQEGKRIIVLSLGEAFFDIPLFRFDDLPYPSLYHYSHSRGLPELRQKIAEYYKRMFNVCIDPERELLVTAGSKAAIHFSLMAVLNPGDEVILQEPTWVSYPEQIKLNYAEPVLLPYDADLREYDRHITSRTRMIIVNNPHNPRGEVLGRKELQYLVDLTRQNDLYLLCDEAYSDFVLDGSFVSAGAVDPSKEHVIVCNSISKNLGISGWRLGYVFSNAAIISQVLKVNQHIVTCPATILQQYVARHFDSLLSICRPQIESLAEKRRAVDAILQRLEFATLPGSSTFYFFVSIAPSKLGSEDFCMRLLREHHISVVPGIGYGESCDNWVRVSIGTESIEAIDDALTRMRQLIQSTS